MQRLIHKLKIDRKKLILVLCFLVVFGVGGIVGVFGFKYLSACKVKYSYINSSLGCSPNTDFDKSNPIVLKDKLMSFINSEQKSGDINEVSVYFRDLNDGPTLGINEDDLFISASLLKLPIALTFYKLSEEEIPDILSQKLGFQITGGKDELVQFFKPSKSVDPNSTYTVSDLTFYSLAYSDNLSNDVLRTYLGTLGSKLDLLLRTFKELGLVEPASITALDISTRAYASIFRQLYNASYLSNEDSEKILSILAQSEFDLGIVGGVPKGVVIANKFGERDLGKEKQLHDCGIVYYPGNPYLICVMTRGTDYGKLADVIKEISSIVYKEMDSRAKAK